MGSEIVVVLCLSESVIVHVTEHTSEAMNFCGGLDLVMIFVWRYWILSMIRMILVVGIGRRRGVVLAVCC